MKLTVKYSFPIVFVLMLMTVADCSAQQYIYMPGVWKLKKITPKLDTASSAVKTDTTAKTDTLAKANTNTVALTNPNMVALANPETIAPPRPPGS